jgi:5-methylcytosine-specific restriction endonuclease McrA
MPAAPTPHPGGISRYAGRSTRRYKTTRNTYRQQCAQTNEPCWLCGRTIDYTLQHPHPDSFNLDHAYPLDQRPDLAEDPANYRPSHKDCNEQRGNNEPHIQLGTPSEKW